MAALLIPALWAVWTTPWFVSQDGPAHLYNSVLLRDLWRGLPPVAQLYRVRGHAIPNWAGHALTVALLPFGPRAANALVLTLTMTLLGAAVLRFRRTLVPPSGERREHPLLWGAWAAALSVNYIWLIGFTGFLIGAALLLFTWRFYWERRDRNRPADLALLSLLLVGGWFCHLVSLAVTVLGLLVIALTAPPSAPDTARLRRRLGVRLASLALCGVPLLPLALSYGRVALEASASPDLTGGALSWTVSGWYWHLYAVDPLSLAPVRLLPFVHRGSRWAQLIAPSLWISAGLAGLLLSSMRRRQGGRPIPWTWVALALLLTAAAAFGPDRFAHTGGGFLAPRLALLGLAAWTPLLAAPRRRWPAVLFTALLAAAALLQAASVWDYARVCRQRARGLEWAQQHLPRGPVTVAAYPGPILPLFRADPRLHFDDLLGLDGRILWNNYEAALNYFPVEPRPEARGVSPEKLARITTLCTHDDPERIRAWRDLLVADAPRVDYLVVWAPEEVDSVQMSLYRAISPEGFRPRIYQRREINSE